MAIKVCDDGHFLSVHYEFCVRGWQMPEYMLNWARLQTV